MHTCKKCQSSFEVTAQEKEIIDGISVEFGGRKFNIPLPTLCPLCRQQRRLTWRNERNLYTRKCDATGKKLISNISPDKPFKVFDKEYWFSDNYKPLEYGREYDFNRSFFEQFRELQKAVPRFSIQQQEPMQNSDYCNFASNCKNCYFLFDSDYCEDCLYSNVLKKSRTSCDCSFTSNSELCYETVNCDYGYRLIYSRNCSNCSDSSFLYSCTGCRNCCFSVNLNNKQYVYKNEQLSKEDYDNKIAELDLVNYDNLKKYNQEFTEYIKTRPHKFRQGTLNENVTGDYINRSKNVVNSFNLEEGWDICNSDLLYRAKNCVDVSSFGEGIEWMYECVTAGLNSRNCAFCFTSVVGSGDLFYCDTAYSGKNCFGCVGLNHNQYCILNRQYSKEEYETLASEIIGQMQANGEWGEFFPVNNSPFDYNETVAMDYFPSAKEEVLSRGWRWKDMPEPDFSSVIKKIPAEKLPSSIDKIPDDVLNWAIKCEKTGKLFKIQKAELRFYRTMNLPLPHLHPDERHKNRMNLVRSRVLYDRKCDKCSSEIKTTYSPDYPNKVYCEQCYLKEVY